MRMKAIEMEVQMQKCEKGHDDLLGIVGNRLKSRVPGS